ncbi:hypothetical protein MMC13_008120 [Lambiella insularis]|nr:hypothetical protein [Lambiella insularis]
MAPKPFPSQFRIGTDITKISRFQQILDTYTGERLHRWARRTFNGLEWPTFLSKIERYGSEHHVDVAQWLAGRWAAKEAAVKAHPSRRLLRPQISILVPPQEGALGLGVTIKPQCLIDPPRPAVIMNRSTAIKRGLESLILESNTTRISYPTGSTLDTSLKAIATSAGLPTQEAIFARPLRTIETERRVADLSISHDGSYAIAVCMALDEDWEESNHAVIDSGEGESIHEPQWGDQGFGLHAVC